MKDWYYVITESMLDLGLRGTELNLFAIIFGYSQRGDGCCYATRQELARRCGVASRRTIDSAISALIEKGLIRRDNVVKNGKEMTAYSYIYEGAKIAPSPVQNLHPMGVQKFHKGGANSAHMENKEEKKVDNKTTPTPSSFTPPTFDQVVDYCKSRGFADPEGFADYYIETSNNNGWRKKDGTPVTNWKNNVLVWEKYHKEEAFPKRRPVTAGRTVSTLSPIYR